MKNFIVSPKQGVPFVSVTAMAEMINIYRVENSIRELVGRLEQDFFLCLKA